MSGHLKGFICKYALHMFFHNGRPITKEVLGLRPIEDKYSEKLFKNDSGK